MRIMSELEDPRPEAPPAPPDLATQLEDLVIEVWRCEADWRVDDRIDLALKVASRGTRAR